MITTIVLDTTPLSLITHQKGNTEAEACRRWLRKVLDSGLVILVPEIADYEVRREFVRSGNSGAISRLDGFIAAPAGRYVPITTAAMRVASDLWASARNTGTPTADRHALDGDVILAAQAQTLGILTTEIVVATSNAAHLSRYVTADHWLNITP